MNATETPDLRPGVTYGIWADPDGAIVEGELHHTQVAFALAQAIEGGYDPDEVSVVETCPDHMDEPRTGCQECPDEDTED